MSETKYVVRLGPNESDEHVGRAAFEKPDGSLLWHDTTGILHIAPPATWSYDRVSDRDAKALVAIRSCKHHSIMTSSPHGEIQSSAAFRLCLNCGAWRDVTHDWETPWYACVVTDLEQIAAQDRAIASASGPGGFRGELPIKTREEYLKFDATRCPHCSGTGIEERDG